MQCGNAMRSGAGICLKLSQERLSREVGEGLAEVVMVELRSMGVVRNIQAEEGDCSIPT